MSDPEPETIAVLTLKLGADKVVRVEGDIEPKGRSIQMLAESIKAVLAFVPPVPPPTILDAGGVPANRILRMNGRG